MGCDRCAAQNKECVWSTWKFYYRNGRVQILKGYLCPVCFNKTKGDRD